MSNTGYGAVNYGQLGYGAIPPDGLSASNSVSFMNQPYIINVKSDNFRTRNIVKIVNRRKTVVVLQPLTNSRTNSVRIFPSRCAEIDLDEYDLAQVNKLRRQGSISVERT